MGRSGRPSPPELWSQTVSSSARSYVRRTSSFVAAAGSLTIGLPAASKPTITARCPSLEDIAEPVISPFFHAKLKMTGYARLHPALDVAERGEPGNLGLHPLVAGPGGVERPVAVPVVEPVEDAARRSSRTRGSRSSPLIALPVRQHHRESTSGCTRRCRRPDRPSGSTRARSSERVAHDSRIAGWSVSAAWARRRRERDRREAHAGIASRRAEEAGASGW